MKLPWKHEPSPSADGPSLTKVYEATQPAQPVAGLEVATDVALVVTLLNQAQFLKLVPWGPVLEVTQIFIIDDWLKDAAAGLVKVKVAGNPAMIKSTIVKWLKEGCNLDPFPKRAEKYFLGMAPDQHISIAS